MIIKKRILFVGFDKETKIDLESGKYERAGTSLQARMDISYFDIVNKLGLPNISRDYKEGDKTDAEWEIITPDGIAIIYNYKDGKNYNGKDGLRVQDIRDWHVGGRGIEVVSHILLEFKDCFIKKHD